LTVIVEEVADAQRQTGTDLSKQAEMNADVQAFLGVMGRLRSVDALELPAGSLLQAAGSKTFESKGKTSRTENLSATVPVIVRKVLSNGNLFVEGHRTVLVNEERHDFYLSGVARPHDVDEQNTISSSRLADAQIEFTGAGALSASASRGWFSEFIDMIWPF
jgi:flagellar L-ring protein precursor FlgH